ncbi:MAG TPA: hypothetical protein VGE35_03485 [Candidatus Paceibacterota bacterium]
MTGEISIKRDSDVATRGDVKEIVERAINSGFESFAIIVGKSFEQMTTYMDTRFDAIDVRFDAVEGRLDRVEIRLDKVEARLDGVEGRLDKVEGRLSDVEEKIDAVFGIMEIDGINLDDDSDGEDRLWKDIERRWPKS